MVLNTVQFNGNYGCMKCETKSTVHGVKGLTWLSKVNCFDVILWTGVDYMYSVLLGVMHTLMFLWFSTELSREPFSMAKESRGIDKRLSEIHPPSTVTRHPHSVSSHRMYCISKHPNTVLSCYFLDQLFSMAFLEQFIITTFFSLVRQFSYS